MTVFDELKRRNVFRVAAAYIVAAWLIIQVVDTVFPAFGSDNNAVRFAVIILAIGLVPTLIGAWVFEWTPDGIKFDREADRSAPASLQARKNLDRIILVILTVAVGYFAFDKFVLDPVRDKELAEQAVAAARSESTIGFYGDRSIAVLPFVNMSSDPEQEFFAEGISEEVLNLLAKIRQLRVISRSSAFAFKGQGLEIPEIAERLNVAHVLEGSVRKAGNTVRVTAQLIDARSDMHLWSETYDRGLENIFAIQDEIATDVAKNLEITLLEPLPKSRVTDPEVRALTLQAKQIYERRPPGTGQKMYALLSRALAIDPDYVPALELISNADFFREREGILSEDEMWERWYRLENRILELDPDNAHVVAGNAWTEFRINNNLEKAAAMYEEAIAKDAAHSDVVRLAATFAAYIGHFEIAVRLAEHAAAIDPLCYQCLYWVSRTHLYAGNYEKALEARERYLGLGSGGFYQLGLIKLLEGKPREALQIDWPDEMHEHTPAINIMANFDLGNVDLAEELYMEFVDAHAGELEFLAEVAGWIGKRNEAFAFLHEIKARGGNGSETIRNPAFRKLHDDPRWTEWRESVDMSEERLAAIKFDPDLPE